MHGYVLLNPVDWVFLHSQDGNSHKYSEVIIIMARKHMIPIGAPAVGKGCTAAFLKQKFGDSMFAVNMGRSIRSRLKEPEYWNNYGKVVQDGRLLPDSEVTAIIKEEYSSIPHNASLIYWDGCFRTSGQIKWALESGIFGTDNSVCVILNASRTTLLERHHKRVQTKPDGTRLDEGAFANRLQVFNDQFLPTLRLLQASGVRIIHVDANRPLLTEVVPDVVALANHMLS